MKKRNPRWIWLGKLEMKVAFGRTERGVLYLNFFIKHLKSTGFNVGGLLGEDDYTDAATPDKKCKRTVSLRNTVPDQTLSTDASGLGFEGARYMDPLEHATSV